MRPIVKLHKPAYLANPAKLEILNRILQTHKTLMLHQVATSLGCSRVDALTLLFILFNHGLVELYLLTYHIEHPDAPFEATLLTEGLPDLPIVCDLCDQIITDRDSLQFDLSAQIKSEFRVEYIKNVDDRY